MMNSAKRQIARVEARFLEIENRRSEQILALTKRLDALEGGASSDRPEPIAAAPAVPAKKAARKAAPAPDSGTAH